MSSYEHKKLIERLAHLDTVSDNAKTNASWLKAERHLTLLRDNAQENELAIYASGAYTFIHTVVVTEASLSLLAQEDLLQWAGHPSSPAAGYACIEERDGVRIERGVRYWSAKTVEGGRQLVFWRTFDGWEEEGRSYFEILQEYAHLTESHWRPEHHAYCRFDGNGDLEHVVSATSESDIKLVSFKREPLEQYLAASNSVLVRKFDFTLSLSKNFSGWPDGPEDVFNENEDFFYRQKNAGYAAYTRGIQIIRPSRPKSEILSSLVDSWFGHKEKQYIEFIAHDWRNDFITTRSTDPAATVADRLTQVLRNPDRITTISTDPAATTNYFEARKNSLPFEMSPAFFDPEVLLRYKGDQDKYAVGTREIRCRNTWVLRRYDVNEAGQVHAYIHDLRDLPYHEQQYWASFNEEPKAGISQRALAHDFKGEMRLITDPLDDVLAIVRRWAESDLTWWKIREERLLERVSTPLTESRDEWAEAFMNLSKLIVEGFQDKAIRAKLRNATLSFDERSGSIALIEKFLVGLHKSTDSHRLEGLRTVRDIRSKVKGHPGGEDATKLAQDALRRHDTYSAHFSYVCINIANELRCIEQIFS